MTAPYLPPDENWLAPHVQGATALGQQLLTQRPDALQPNATPSLAAQYVAAVHKRLQTLRTDPLAPLKALVAPVVQQAQDAHTLAAQPNGPLVGLLTDPNARQAAARTALNLFGTVNPFEEGAAAVAAPEAAPAAAPNVFASALSDVQRHAIASEDMIRNSNGLSAFLKRVGDTPVGEMRDRDWLHLHLLKHEQQRLTGEFGLTAQPPAPSPLPPPPGAGWYDVQTPAGLKAVRASSPQDALAKMPGRILRYQSGETWKPSEREGMPQPINLAAVTRP